MLDISECRWKHLERIFNPSLTRRLVNKARMIGCTMSHLFEASHCMVMLARNHLQLTTRDVYHFQPTPLREYLWARSIWDLLMIFQRLVDSTSQITLRREDTFHLIPHAFTHPDSDG
jgi:hypothetical protein